MYGNPFWPWTAPQPCPTCGRCPTCGQGQRFFRQRPETQDGTFTVTPDDFTIRNTSGTCVKVTGDGRTVVSQD